MNNEKFRKETLRERLEHDENAWLESRSYTDKELAQLAGMLLRTRIQFRDDLKKNKERIKKLEKQIEKLEKRADRNDQQNKTRGPRSRKVDSSPDDPGQGTNG